MTNTWFVYMLQLSSGTLYTGITNDVENRMEMHNKGKGSKYVRAHLPFKLVYLEEMGGRSAATRREIQIKRMGRFQKLVLCTDGSNMVHLGVHKKWIGNLTIKL